jgi:FkbH-like protein
MSTGSEQPNSTLENEPERAIAIAATFTAEPVEESLKFWGVELDLRFRIEFAPYNQVFQQLLDPSSFISKNSHGMNVILLRFEDWLGDGKKSDSGKEGKIKDNVEDLVNALKSALERSSTPYLVCICPPSPAVAADASRTLIHKEMENFMLSELDRMSNVYFLRSSALTSAYPVSTYYDPHSDELGHVPYTPDLFTALGTMIVRKFYRIQSAPYKVVALDCDHTLWNGVCGEDGPLGVRIDQPHKELQEFVVQQIDAGMVICLCSKNNEEDVIDVFERRPEMPLKRDHIVSSRINWRPKSENLRSLASELQLGLDSFIFIDDNPVECAEVQANCPEVLCLQLPKEAENIPRFLNHVWAFDHLKITEEDRKRTSMYQENLRREQLRHESLTFGDFLAGLGLEVKTFEPMPHHVPRAAQLTQRTNQFNFTTIRRSEAELQKLLKTGGLECLCVEVSDRFGDYGLVGVIVFKAEAEAIKVDTLLLSCRVLGRGVEHQMLAALGVKAQERGLTYVEVTYVPTAKNQLVAEFLDSIGSKYKESLGEGLGFLLRFPAQYARGVNVIHSLEKPMGGGEGAEKKGDYSQKAEKVIVPLWGKSERLSYIARNLTSAEQITKMIESRHWKQRPALPIDYVAPSNELEKSICKIWEKVLGVEKVGIHDNFFQIGGQSLLGTRILSRLRQETGVGLRLPHLFGSPTVASIANLIETLQVVRRDRLSTGNMGNAEREVIAF